MVNFETTKSRRVTIFLSTAYAAKSAANIKGHIVKSKWKTPKFPYKWEFNFHMDKAECSKFASSKLNTRKPSQIVLIGAFN